MRSRAKRRLRRCHEERAGRAANGIGGYGHWIERALRGGSFVALTPSDGNEHRRSLRTREQSYDCSTTLPLAENRKSNWIRRGVKIKS